jgi:hypothetical protein
MQVELLAALNVVVYGFLISGLVVLARTPRLVENSFEALGQLLKETFPELPAGFTLREGLVRAREARPELDWVEIDRELRAYEDYRYGGLPRTASSVPALSGLISALRRSER